MTIESLNTSNAFNPDKVQSEHKPEINVKPKVMPKQVATKSTGDNASDDVYELKNEQDEKKLKNAMTEINNKMKQSRSQVEFTYHKEVNRVSIKVVDSETQDVIREIPPEDTIEMIKKMWKVAGILVDKKL